MFFAGMGVVYDVLLGAENREGRSQNATETIATPVGSPDGEPIGVQYEVMKGKVRVHSFLLKVSFGIHSSSSSFFKFMSVYFS